MQVRTGDASTHCELLGSGPPLVVIHGGLGSDHQVFRPWLDPLAANSTVVYVDLLGNGRSDDPDDWASVDLSLWTRQLEALREELAFERWTVLGHSFGGIVAQAYALAHQDRLDGLIVCCSGSKIDHFDESFALARRHATQEELALMTSGLFREMPSDEEFARVWETVAPAYWVDRERRSQIRPRSRFSSQAFNAAVRILPTVDFLDRLGELQIATLVIGAAEDWSFPPGPGPRRTHAHIPGSRYVEFPASGHYPFVEENEAFLAVVAGWLLELRA